MTGLIFFLSIFIKNGKSYMLHFKTGLDIATQNKTFNIKKWYKHDRSEYKEIFINKKND